jgi:hypothetical protein
MQQGVVNRLHCLVVRFERELPEVSIAELDSILAEVKERGAKATEVAFSLGFIKA